MSSNIKIILDKQQTSDTDLKMVQQPCNIEFIEFFQL